MKRLSCINWLLIFFNTTLFPAQPFPRFFKELSLLVDTSAYTYPVDTIHFHSVPCLVFRYQNTETPATLSFRLYDNSINRLFFIPAAGIQLLDSVYAIDGEFRCRFLFNQNLTTGGILPLTFVVPGVSDSNTRYQRVYLFPVTKTTIQLRPLNNTLYIGEEMVTELYTNHPENIRITNTWATQNNIDYKLSEKFGQVRLHLVANELGNKTIRLRLQTYIPDLNEKKKPVYDLPEISYDFTVQKSRLQFLSIDNNDITLDNKTKLDGIEVQIDNSLLLQTGKTYRIEASEEQGSPLIAELYTKNHLANNKVLCVLRVYNYHRKPEGYLYIKDGDKSKFITNFNITPQTTISKLSILRPGEDWTTRPVVYPGEQIEVKLEGEALYKADIEFPGAILIEDQSLYRSEDVATYRITIPYTINKKTIELLNHKQRTAHSLKVSEHQKPRAFDFITLVPDNSSYRISEISKPLMCRKTMSDIIVTFDPQKIDEQSKLYGKQYLTLTVRIIDRKNNLIELRELKNIVVCPGENSHRHIYYTGDKCQIGPISINSLINHKTYDLEEWSKLEITLQHQPEKYTTPGEAKQIDIYLQRLINFDIDVSFPAGLLIKKGGESGYGSFSGISMAMIAQFSFYHPHKIARFRPYKIGAGFLALNAFDYSDNSSRDVGAVVLGSLYPTTRDSRLSFPLFLGGGYLLDSKRWFYLVGPGIRIKL